MMKMIKNFMSEISQVTWISNRQLMIDTGYVLAFTIILLLYFMFVDGILGEVIKNLLSNR